HAVARLHGKRLEGVVTARTPDEQRAHFERSIAPLFDYKSIRFLSRMPVSLYALGIPPAQYDELVGASNGDPVSVLRRRAEMLAALWREINRTADAQDARVIFRTAGEDSPLPRKLPAELLANWEYLEAASRRFHAQDRSSIYGGFHVYRRRAGI